MSSADFARNEAVPAANVVGSLVTTTSWQTCSFLLCCKQNKNISFRYRTGWFRTNPDANQTRCIESNSNGRGYRIVPTTGYPTQRSGRYFFTGNVTNFILLAQRCKGRRIKNKMTWLVAGSNGEGWKIYILLYARQLVHANYCSLRSCALHVSCMHVHVTYSSAWRRRSLALLSVKFVNRQMIIS